MDISINIPEHSYQTEYKSSRIPGVDDQSNLALGANCQVFAYELLKVNGLEAKNDRSSELWSDESYSVKVDRFEPLDLMLYNHNAEAYGAHVGVYIGEGKVIHLSLENGKPEITTHEQMLKNERYRVFNRFRYQNASNT